MQGDMRSTRITRTCVAHYYNLCIDALFVSGPGVWVQSWIFRHHYQGANLWIGGRRKVAARANERKGKERKGKTRRGQ